MTRLEHADPIRDLAILYGTLFVMPLLILTMVAVAGAIESLWLRITRR